MSEVVHGGYGSDTMGTRDLSWGGSTTVHEYVDGDTASDTREYRVDVTESRRREDHSGTAFKNFTPNCHYNIYDEVKLLPDIEGISLV